MQRGLLAATLAQQGLYIYPHKSPALTGQKKDLETEHSVRWTVTQA